MLLLYRHEKKDLSHKKIYLKLTVAVFSTKFRFFLETSEVGSGKKLKNSLPKKIDIVLDHETTPKREFSFGNKWAVQDESLVASCDEVWSCEYFYSPVHISLHRVRSSYFVNSTHFTSESRNSGKVVSHSCLLYFDKGTHRHLSWNLSHLWYL